MKKILLLIALLPLSATAAEKKVVFPNAFPEDDGAILRWKNDCISKSFSIQDRAICQVIAEGETGVDTYVTDDGRVIMRDEKGRPVSITDDGQIVPNERGFTNLNDMGDGQPINGQIQTLPQRNNYPQPSATSGANPSRQVPAQVNRPTVNSNINAAPVADRAPSVIPGSTGKTNLMNDVYR